VMHAAKVAATSSSLDFMAIPNDPAFNAANILFPTVCTFRFDCFKFEFHSGAAATFATISAKTGREQMQQ
jgi:hypothetical protein